MKRILFALLLCLGLSRSAFAADDAKAAKPTSPEGTNAVAVLSFKDFGEIVFEFFPDIAPKTVENFRKLAESGFYNGTRSHRLIPGFMIQLGDPLTKDANLQHAWGTGDPGYKIQAEFNKTEHVKGVVSMARSAADPDSAGSQFFICFGRAGHLDGQYTAFARVLKGQDILDKLEKVPVGGRGGSVPKTPVILESVKITDRASLK
jgi:peptidyl-prolyl cis-trans isomerase B (cyclophilin B)